MIADDVVFEGQVLVAQPDLVNLYGCHIGDGTRIGAFVEIQKGVRIGQNVKIQAFAFIPEGVTIEDGVFIGPHVCFTNDRHPRAVDKDGNLLAHGDWVCEPTLVRTRASIGANATIRCGVTIGREAMVAAGAIVTRDVPDGALAISTSAKATES